jgi:EAL domain-containing protein (putative c-di-GMP-specific phosphodiesterase class I)
VLLGRKFSMTVIAEGVETVAQWQALKDLGVDQAQGYLLSRPRPASEILDWLTNEEPHLGELISLAGSLEETSQQGSSNTEQ